MAKSRSKNRVLTYVFAGSVIGVAGVGGVFTLGARDWLMQEANELLGYQITVTAQTVNENDGHAQIYLELSQAAAWAVAGSIAFAKSTDYWNTTPAGVQQVDGNTELMFNPGQEISLEEGDHLFLNFVDRGKSAGTTSWDYDVVIYYRHK